MTRVCLQRKMQSRSLPKRRTISLKLFWNLRLQDSRILAAHLKGSEKEHVLLTVVMLESLDLYRYDWCHSQRHPRQREWSSRINPRRNIKVDIYIYIFKLGLLLIRLLKEKQYAVFEYTSVRRMNTKVHFTSRVAWWQMSTCRHYESTIMTHSRLLHKVLLRFVLSLALHLWSSLSQLDIDTAFLYGNLKETVYMIKRDGFDDGSGRACLLEKGIFDLKQSGKEWYIGLCVFSIPLRVEVWNQDKKCGKTQTHTGCPCRVCGEWDFPL